MMKKRSFVLFLLLSIIIASTGCSSNEATQDITTPVIIPADGLNTDYAADQQYQITTAQGALVSFGHGIEIDADTHFYTSSDAPDNKVYKISIATGNAVTSFGSTGTGDGEFNTPFDIAWFNDLNIFVTDRNNNRVQKFNSSGLFLKKFDASESGTALSGPKGCAVSQAGYLYVVDALNNRIVKFDTDGVFVKQIGTGFGTGDTQLNSPTGIAVDLNNNIYVADTGNNRVIKYNSDGVFMKRIGSYGTDPGQMISPLDVTVTNTNRLFVTDSANHRISCFDLDGGFIQVTGSFGTGLSSLNIPRGAACDTSARIYIVDEGNLRIKRFIPKRQ
jgi:sugar lactone lactonase YvrE